MTVKKPLALSHARFRSALTSGRNILQDVDGRSSQARRFRDLFVLYVDDLGGERASLSEAQLCIARRAACLTVELERMETTFAQNEGAKVWQLEAYQRGTNTLRRLLESLGVHRGRKARDVTPSLNDYIEGKSRRVRIEHDDDDELEAAE